MTMPLLKTQQLCLTTPNGRVLVDGLNMSLGTEHVAIVGRNGVGKSTLLRNLSGQQAPLQGEVMLSTRPYLVPQPCQILSAKSHGEQCRIELEKARVCGARLLLLDEPSQHLDQEGKSWLVNWLQKWRGGLLVVSHDPQILRCFQNFFIVSEQGCRCFSGTLDGLREDLESEAQRQQERYLKNLRRMVQKEEHILHVTRRRARKRQYGRCREIDRATPRATLNQKRDYAQVKHGRMKQEREAKLQSIREWTKETRRALRVELPLNLAPIPALSRPREPIIELRNVGARTKERLLFRDVNLSLRHQKMAITGANGTGKTTLIEIAVGNRPPQEGQVSRAPGKIGYIAQGGSNWMLKESLMEHVSAEHLLAHKFPLALAERPLKSLSPGERVRAALLCLFQRAPKLELLVLDEPTYSLDLIGRTALIKALKAWPGGMLVASHDLELLHQTGFHRVLTLSPSTSSQRWSQSGS